MKNEKCCVPDCSNKPYAKSMCQPHYGRLRRNQNLEGQFRKFGNGYINKDGYRRIMINGISYLEHRYVIERKIKRKLRRWEIVHHKNGNKLDNRIDNLEIMNWIEHNNHHNPKTIRNCSIFKCERTYHLLGYCLRHYHAFKKYGNPLHKTRAYPGEFIKCSVNGCPNKKCAFGFCQAHYTRGIRKRLGKKPKIKRRTLP